MRSTQHHAASLNSGVVDEALPSTEDDAVLQSRHVDIEVQFGKAEDPLLEEVVSLRHKVLRLDYEL